MLARKNTVSIELVVPEGCTSDCHGGSHVLLKESPCMAVPFSPAGLLSLMGMNSMWFYLKFYEVFYLKVGCDSWDVGRQTEKWTQFQKAFDLT